VGKAGKGITATQLKKALAEHYDDVTWDVSFVETKGSTCKVMINKTQAVAGQNFKNDPAAMLDRKAYASVASLAEEIAGPVYEAAEKELPKKLSAQTLESA
jgi:hypothetical protein